MLALLQTGLTRQRHAVASQITKATHCICSGDRGTGIPYHQEDVIMQMQSQDVQDLSGIV